MPVYSATKGWSARLLHGAQASLSKLGIKVFEVVSARRRHGIEPRRQGQTGQPQGGISSRGNSWRGHERPLSDVVEIGYGNERGHAQSIQGRAGQEAFQKNEQPGGRGSSVASQHHFFTPSCFRWIGCRIIIGATLSANASSVRNAKVRNLRRLATKRIKQAKCQFPDAS